MKLFKNIELSVFLIILACMLKSGFSFNDALKKIKNTSSPWLNDFIDDMIKDKICENNI